MEIQVVKEIVPRILNPSGVVAMIGTAEKGPILTTVHVSSYQEFAEKFGSDPSYTLVKDAKQAFQNGVFEIVAVRVAGAGGKKASITLKDKEGKDALTLTAVDEGQAGNEIEVGVEPGSTEDTFNLTIKYGRVIETYTDVSMNPKHEKYVVNEINKKSTLVKASIVKPATKNVLAEFKGKLSGGKDPGEPGIKDFEEALEKLEAEPDVDVVLACNSTNPEIHAKIDAHCKVMSKDAMGRIGIGSVAKGESIDDMIKKTEKLKSDRFVLVAPFGVAGAVAGLISNLNYYESPTFKPLAGVFELERQFTPSQLRQLLKAGILPVVAQKERGIIVVKGITTSGEQISVIRVVDRAVRGVNSIAADFIGTLNNESSRLALKQKITWFLSRMESEGALVPSVDGQEPAFMVDVYSTKLDFAQGIVRVDLAVRPVRAIDYIYATLLVQI